MDFFLLDTNLFREATKSPDNKLLNALIPALRSRGLEFGLSDPTAIRISPFALWRLWESSRPCRRSLTQNGAEEIQRRFTESYSTMPVSPMPDPVLREIWVTLLG
jgi:hypothetical protein